MKRNLIAAALLASCLTAALLTLRSTESQTSLEYDPWKDLNDDGKLDILDIVRISSEYGAQGTPLNKTELLLQLQNKVDTLEEKLALLNASFLDSFPATNCTFSRAYASLNTPNNWTDLPDMKVSLAFNKASFVRITMSATLLANEVYIRALVDSQPGNPSSGYSWRASGSYASMDFYLLNVTAGAHEIRMQWYICNPGIAEVYDRTLITTAYSNH